jgi:hypothetical protein
LEFNKKLGYSNTNSTRRDAMQARTRIGLIVGVIGLILNTCVAGLFGFCGPVLALIAGAIAGWFAVRQEKPLTKNEGARAGATAGGIAGGLIIIGQILGGIGALVFMQASGSPTILGPLPELTGDPAAQVGFYAGGLGTALCFGIVGALLAAGAGAGAGYLTTTDQPMMPPSQNVMS